MAARRRRALVVVVAMPGDGAAIVLHGSTHCTRTETIATGLCRNEPPCLELREIIVSHQL